MTEYFHLIDQMNGQKQTSKKNCKTVTFRSWLLPVHSCTQLDRHGLKTVEESEEMCKMFHSAFVLWIYDLERLQFCAPSKGEADEEY